MHGKVLLGAAYLQSVASPGQEGGEEHPGLGGSQLLGN